MMRDAEMLMKKPDMTDADPVTPTVPVTRRAQAKAVRRQVLIEATISSIAEYGLSGTTIARVTTIAGTSIGLANFHFANKEHLFEAVLQHLADVEKAIWQESFADLSMTPAQRLVDLVKARFDPRICNPRILSVWFAFWGDAAARAVYRKIVVEADDARLDATVDLITCLEIEDGTHDPLRDPEQKALGLEAFYDGLWLNHLLYPEDFSRESCETRAVEGIAAMFPHHFNGLQPVVGQALAKPLTQGT